MDGLLNPRLGGFSQYLPRYGRGYGGIVHTYVFFRGLVLSYHVRVASYRGCSVVYNTTDEA